MIPEPETRIYSDSLSVDHRLEALGLQREQIERAVFISEYYRDQRTDNDAPGAQGWIAYTWCVRAFREILIPLGWTRSNDQNRATIVRPDGKVAVSVVVGDEGTGRDDLISNVKTPKGRATTQAVGQQSLFEDFYNVTPMFGATELQTWFLLRRRTDDAVFLELSLPARMVDGHVERWVERIILGQYPYDSQFSIEEDFDTESIDIPIRRRQD